MKKLIPFIIISIITSVTVYAAEVDEDPTADWYQYNGYSTSHSFSVKFPQDWQSRTYGDDTQGFAPEEAYGDAYLLIQEFEGITYEQALQFYANSNTELVESKDFIFSNGSDLVAKEAIYLDLDENKEYPRTFIKRGSLIVVISGKNKEDVEDFPIPDEYRETIDTIYSTFEFTDDWHQYIDLEEGYTFIFPAALKAEILSNGVTIVDPDDENKIIFSVFKYENTTLEDAPEKAEGYNEDLENTEETFFHGIGDVILATYYDSDEKKDFQRYFVEKNGTSYSISGENIEVNFPRMDYYNQYVLEMVESFELFDTDNVDKVFTFTRFPDVSDTHPNKMAINSLADRGIIAGYPDGTFQPNGEINRAELTKMVVATRLEPDPEVYKDCFPDVEDEWFAPYVCYAKEQEWVAGYDDGTFKPNQEITRVEAIKVILEVLFEDLEEEPLEDTSVLDISEGKWYSKYFNFADNRDLLDKQHIETEGESYYYLPSQNITRKEVAETIYRSIMNFTFSFL